MELQLVCENGHQWTLASGSADATLDAAPACPTCGASGSSAAARAIRPTLGVDPTQSQNGESPPSRGLKVPGYEIVRELGRGGMGVVYLARQTKLGRLVALKTILSGVHAGERERQRFLAEAGAAARLQHPNIVQIHEIGEIDGHPFFSLEYVDGGSLAEKLTGTPLPAREAASLMIPLARATQAAHDAGIVHRDLKPANILLSAEYGVRSAELSSLRTPHSALRTPKITDFGLAKIVDSSDGPTQTGNVLGTPSYMSPEQASGQTRLVGPPADIYALGAILYELLTGRPPFRGETPLDTIIQATTDEPVPPRQLQPKCPRDLETICLKCLHKEPKKRYASAGELTDDLQRFLNGESIRARPVGPLGRTSRWARRNPAVAALLSLLFVVMTVGLIVTSSLWLKARREHQETLNQEQRAKRNLHLAIDAVDRMLTRLADERLAYVPQFEDERRQILEEAVGYYDQFLQQQADDPQLLRQMGRAYYRLGIVFHSLGRFEQARGAFEEAQRLQLKLQEDRPAEPDLANDLAKTLLELAANNRLRDRADAAEPQYLRAKELSLRLVHEHPATASYRETLARTLSQLGYHSMQMYRLETAEDWYRQALAEWDRLVEAHPAAFTYALERAKAVGSLAFFHHTLRRFGPAEPLARREVEELLAVLRKHSDRRKEIEPALAAARLRLGSILTETNRSALAEDDLRRGTAVFERLVKDYPQMPSYRLSLSGARQTHAARVRGADPQKAEEALKHSIALLEELDRAHPEAFFHGLHLRRGYEQLSRFYQGQNKFGPALETTVKAAASAREDAAAARANSMVQFDFTSILKHQAELLGLNGKPEEGLKVLDEVLERARTVHQQPATHAEVLDARVRRAILLARAGREPAAAQEANELAASAGKGTNLTYNLACVFAQCAGAVRTKANLDSPSRERLAQDYLKRSRELIEELQAAGYFRLPARVRQLHQDPDLEPLRAEPGFRRWMDEQLPAPAPPK